MRDFLSLSFLGIVTISIIAYSVRYMRVPKADRLLTTLYRIYLIWTTFFSVIFLMLAKELNNTFLALLGIISFEFVWYWALCWIKLTITKPQERANIVVHTWPVLTKGFLALGAVHTIGWLVSVGLSGETKLFLERANLILALGFTIFSAELYMTLIIKELREYTVVDDPLPRYRLYSYLMLAGIQAMIIVGYIIWSIMEWYPVPTLEFLKQGIGIIILSGLALSILFFGLLTMFDKFLLKVFQVIQMYFVRKYKSSLLWLYESSNRAHPAGYRLQLRSYDGLKPDTWLVQATVQALNEIHYKVCPDEQLPLSTKSKLWADAIVGRTPAEQIKGGVQELKEYSPSYYVKLAINVRKLLNDGKHSG